jgi:hypothetical protein
MNRYGTTLLRRLLPLSILTLAALAGCDNHDLSTGPAPGAVLFDVSTGLDLLYAHPGDYANGSIWPGDPIADDFVVNEGTTWTVTHVELIGQPEYGVYPGDARITLYILGDVDWEGDAHEVLATYADLAPSTERLAVGQPGYQDTGSYRYLMELPGGGITLPPGRYWLAGTATAAVEFWWYFADEQDGQAPRMFEDWVPVVSMNDGLLFRLYGAETAPGPCVVENTADDGAGSLRAAIGNAACTSISFDAALSGQTIALTSGELVIERALTITGPGAGQLAVSGGGSSRVVRVGYGIEASISGLTITGGDAMSGGGIYNYGTLALADCVVSGNRANSNGGGIHNEWNQQLTLSDCTVSGNSAYTGAGIFNSGVAILTRSTISGNSAVTKGGGIYQEDGTLAVVASTVAENTATAGGGLYAYSYNSVTQLINSTISGNSASYRGGGVYVDLGLVRMVLSTITANQAAEGGGGILSNNNIPNQTTVKGSIIWGNHKGSDPDDLAAINYFNRYNGLGYNLVGAAGANVDFSQEFNESTDQTGVDDALLGPLYLNAPGTTRTHALLAGSPALEAGTCQDLGGATVATDQRGVSRPQGALCDIGAYEGVGTVPYAQLVVAVSGEGTVVSEPAGILCSAAGGDCEAGFDFGSDVTLTATAARGGWKFAGWSGDAVGSTSPAVLTMDGPKAVAATFVKGGGVSPVLAVVVTGPGRVTSSPEGIDCTVSGGTCSAAFSKNTTVSLTAIPDVDAAFGGWGGSASGVDNPLQVRISGDLTITARFGALNGPVVGVNASGTVDKRTGAATITGTASCSDPGNIAITVRMEQTQTTGKTTTTITGFGEADLTWCGVDTAWSVIVTPEAGKKFVAGSAVATVHSPGAMTVTQTVNLK